MIANLKGQRLGPGAVADLTLPDAFLRRVAGRTLQAWFNERFRIVVDDLGTEKPEPPPPPSSPSPPSGAIRLTSPPLPVSADAPAKPPPSRNYRWPSADQDAFPYDIPADGAPPPSPELGVVIARSLAKDGLLLCAARALGVITRARAGIHPAEALPMLRASGLPTDLLLCFRPQGVRNGADAVVEWLLRQLEEASPDRLRPVLSKVPFQFCASAPGFAALPDSGQVEPEVLRLQLTRAGYYAAPGDGGSLDLLRQMLEHTSAALLVHAQAGHAEALHALMTGWPRMFRERITLLAQDPPLSQWAQDSARSGRLPGGQAATLVPRFASRGEEASQLVVGDSCIADALAAAGQRVIRSPLLFQGGNLLVVEEPSGPRTLLVGEAEVHRNRALGLSHDQVLAALATEFGAGRTVVLPAASIHLDYEVSIRAHEGGVVALVNDTNAALATVLAECAAPLNAAGLLTADQSRDVRAHAEASRFTQVLDLIGPSLARAARGPGQFPLSLADHFQRGPADSGVGNVLRLLGALDTSTALGKSTKDIDPYLAAYLRAIERQEQDRALIKEQLSILGWTVHAVPSLAMGNRSLNVLNGIHTPRSFLMPAYGGLFAPLDAAAATSIAHAFNGAVEVIPILSGESQRRDGAVHCSVSVVSGR